MSQMTLVAAERGRWPLLTASQLAGVTHRAARTVAATYPALAAPVATHDLLTMRVLAEMLAFTPPPRSASRPSEVLTRQRDAAVIRAAQRIWEERLYSAVLILAPYAAVLCVDATEAGPVLAEITDKNTLVLLPAGAWAKEIADRIV